MMRRLSVVVVFALSVAACGPEMPPLNFSVPNVGPSQTKLDAEVKSITVSVARPDEATGKLAFGVETSAPLWKTSLEEALTKMAIFKDDAPKKVSVAVKVLKLDLPDFGGTFTTETAARYEIIDRSDGSVIFTTDVNSKGEVTLDYAFIGMVRARESINRSVQNNILQFLQQVETVRIDRPMFPVAKAPASPPATISAKGAPTS